MDDSSSANDFLKLIAAELADTTERLYKELENHNERARLYSLMVFTYIIKPLCDKYRLEYCVEPGKFYFKDFNEPPQSINRIISYTPTPGVSTHVHTDIVKAFTLLNTYVGIHECIKEKLGYTLPCYNPLWSYDKGRFYTAEELKDLDEAANK